MKLDECKIATTTIDVKKSETEVNLFINVLSTHEAKSFCCISSHDAKAKQWTDSKTRVKLKLNIKKMVYSMPVSRENLQALYMIKAE